MPRVLVVGQASETGPLPCSEFVEKLSQRLGVPRLPESSHEAPEHWIATEPAGAFTEPLFRRAETVVWLNYSPIAYLVDWLGHQWERIKSLADAEHRAAARAGWNDVVTAYEHLLRSEHMYELFCHPALAHVKVIELRTPRQAQFWLMTQYRRRG